jgi:hypothetical protein
VHTAVIPLPYVQENDAPEWAISFVGNIIQRRLVYNFNILLARTQRQLARKRRRRHVRNEVEVTNSETENSQIRYARLAGFMYLFVDVADSLGMYITGRFHVPGNFAETAHRIMSSELLYRIGLSSFIIAGLCTVFLAVGLYGAVKPINKNLALLAMAFRLVEATLFGVLSVFSFVVLELFIGVDSMNAFNAKQLSILMNLGSVVGSAGLYIAMIFFSMGSVLFFYLFLKSNYIPKVLSALGLFGSVLVPIVCFGFLIIPRYYGILQFGLAPIAIAEILVGLWLLFKGVKLRPRENGAKDLVAAQSTR